MAILNQENSLMEIVKLIGGDVLPDDQKLTLEIAKVIRLGFLQQNAFHKEDTCVSMEKQYKMMEIILYLYKKCRELVARGMPMSVLKAEHIFERIISPRQARRHIPMTMEDWKTKLDAFLRFNDAEVLQDKGKVTAAIAKEFAESEFEKYRVIQDSLYESDFDKLMNDMEKDDAIH